MRSLACSQKARKLIRANSDCPGAKTFAVLVIALESDHGFPLSQLCPLSYSQFKSALEILGEWRLDRRYSGKGRLLDTSLQASELAGG